MRMKKPTRQDALAIPLALLTSTVIVLTYFSVFVYAFSFYSHFGISLNVLNIPLQHFYVYSYSAFASTQGILMLTALLLVGGLLTFFKTGRWLFVPALILSAYMAFDAAYDE